MQDMAKKNSKWSRKHLGQQQKQSKITAAQTSRNEAVS